MPQVFLIEVNTSPALFRAGKYLAELLPKVIEEVVQKAVDTCLPPPPGAASKWRRLMMEMNPSLSPGWAHSKER